MNIWTQMSIDFANQRNYLDELFKIYPLSPNLRREISPSLSKQIENNFTNRNTEGLIKNLFELKLFPIKDSYVSYLKRDPSAISRNPNTINRIAGMLYDMGLDEIFEKCSSPKETNRQMGPFVQKLVEQRNFGGSCISRRRFFSEKYGQCHPQYTRRRNETIRA